MINKENIISKKAQMSYAQILILIISTFAFCYLIYSSTENVFAQGIEDYSCCEKTNEGNYCQFVDSVKCDSSFKTSPTKCEDTSFCELGCCYSPNTGLCSENTPQRSCDGKWSKGGSCNIAECQKSCCVLGNNALWTTLGNCEAESGFLGIETDFRTEINSEVECIFLAEKDDEGACVLEENCRFISRGDCASQGGNFNENSFCSDMDLENNCVKQDYKACIPGKDSVYWFDSCGNREGVAEECSLFAGNYCGLVGGILNVKVLIVLLMVKK